MLCDSLAIYHCSTASKNMPLTSNHPSRTLNYIRPKIDMVDNVLLRAPSVVMILNLAWIGLLDAKKKQIAGRRLPICSLGGLKERRLNILLHPNSDGRQKAPESYK